MDLQDLATLAVFKVHRRASGTNCLRL